MERYESYIYNEVRASTINYIHYNYSFISESRETKDEGRTAYPIIH